MTLFRKELCAGLLVNLTCDLSLLLLYHCAASKALFDLYWSFSSVIKPRFLRGSLISSTIVQLLDIGCFQLQDFVNNHVQACLQQNQICNIRILQLAQE